MLRRVALHPVLIGAFPVVYLWAQNVDEVGPTDAVPALLVVLAATVAVYGLAGLLLRDHRRGAIVASGLALLVLSYGHVQDVTHALDATMLSIWALLLVGLGVVATRVRERVADVTRGLNLAGIVLLVTAVVPLVPGIVGGGQPHRATAAEVGDLDVPDEIPERDIYYIVLDRYPRADNLEELYGYDNAAFLRFLRGTGFQVPGATLANYPKTAHSLAASLNMRYLDGVVPETDGRTGLTGRSWRPVYELLRDHELGRFLTAAGYRYVHLGTWWGPTATAASADVTYRYGTASEFSEVLTHTTPWPTIRRLVGVDGSGSVRDLKRNSTLFQFDRLDQLAAAPSTQPRFVFAHITIPHEPYVFDADGSEVTLRMERSRSASENFVGQVRYANLRLQRLVERLLAGPDERDPIIILQADEGPHPRRYRIQQEDFNWVRASDAELQEKFRILNAYHLPGPDPVTVPDGITPVNTFRLVLDRYLGTDLGMLPDRAYVFMDERHLYDFSDVTDRLRDAPPIPPGFVP